MTPGSGSVAAPRIFPIYPEQFPPQAIGMEHPLQALGYATMGERFLAFLCDASVETALVGAFLALYYLKSSLGFDTLEKIALWTIPVAYMTLAEFFFHRTIGKGLLRIQLRADSPEPRYPTLFKILLRESIGKFICGLISGLAFWRVDGAIKRKPGLT